MSSASAKIRPLRLGLGVLLAAVCALSVHAIMLQELRAPFPELSIISPHYKFAIRVIATLALLILWILSAKNLPRSLAKRWALLFLVSAMLTENLFRGPFMDAYCTNAWAFIFVANISKPLTIALAELMIVVVAPRLRHRPWQTLLAATLITATTTFVIGPRSIRQWSR